MSGAFVGVIGRRAKVFQLNFLFQLNVAPPPCFFSFLELLDYRSFYTTIVFDSFRRVFFHRGSCSHAISRKQLFKRITYRKGKGLSLGSMKYISYVLNVFFSVIREWVHGCFFLVFV